MPHVKRGRRGAPPARSLAPGHGTKQLDHPDASGLPCSFGPQITRRPRAAENSAARGQLRRLLPADRSVRDGRQAPRSAAPSRRAASSTAASRAALVSSTVSVRSGARKRRVKARDLRPGPACSPV